MIDERHPLRRGINSLGMREGEVQESKVFATIGKCLCIWLIWKYAEELIDHWEVLVVLLTFLISPDLIKKMITLYFASKGVNDDRVQTIRATHDEKVVTTGAPAKTGEFT